MRDRSLDQQCTVTRPGLAPIASAISVELLMSVLHHPLGHHAPPEGPRAVDEIIDREFGIVPGQIRGFITHYQNLVLEGRAYELCTACSPKIVSSYLENPNDFIISAVNSPKFLEECSGLSKLKAEIEDKDLEIDMDDFTIVD